MNIIKNIRKVKQLRSDTASSRTSPVSD